MKALHSFSFPWRRVLALFFAFLVCTALWAEATQAQLAEKVIRLHVLANSDSQADQTLKLQVRDKILAQTASLLSGQESAAQAAAILQDNLDALAQTAAQEIAARGYHYPVKVCLEETWFPSSMKMSPFPPEIIRPFGCSLVRAQEKTGGVWSFPPSVSPLSQRNLCKPPVCPTRSMH